MLDNAAFGMLHRKASLPSEDLAFGLGDDGDDEAGSLSSSTSNDDDGDNNGMPTSAVDQSVGSDPVTTATTTTATSQPLPIPLKPSPATSADAADAEGTASGRPKTSGGDCPWSFLHTAAAGSESLSAAVDAARQRVREGQAPVPEVVVVRRRRRDKGGRRPPRPPRLQLGRGGNRRLSLVVEEEEGGWEVVGPAGGVVPVAGVRGLVPEGAGEDKGKGMACG